MSDRSLGANEVRADLHVAGTRGLAHVRTVMLLEFERSLRRRNILPLLGLAAAPLVVFLLWARSGPPQAIAADVPRLAVMFAGVFNVGLIRIMVFFGCLVAFANLFRGEIADRTLHYSLLTPVPRWALVIGKYLAGLLVTATLFGLVTAAAFSLMLLPMEPAAVSRYLLVGGGLVHLAAYVGITVLACMGFGALFTALGLYFRNPIPPVAIIFGWESIHFILPPILKRLSITYYLEEMGPVAVPNSPFAIPAEPVAAAVAVPGLLALTAVLVATAAWRLSHLELPYGTEA